MNKFYITTAIPYVNAKPHVGHALEFVQADTIARFHRSLGEEVCLLSGGDENALKNVQAAEKAGKPIQSFVDENTQSFKDLAEALDVQFDVFQKGSDTKTHYPSSQELWKRCDINGDIYKKTYTGLYCVGCETFYDRDELNENGECFEHPGKPLEEVSEENYFFKLSKYQDWLISTIESDTLKISPQNKKNEVLSFLKNQPLQDISISRTNARAKNWGVPVPGDDSQRIYVWFDALNIYQSGVGFGWDEERYNKWWPADCHVIGKGIIRFHAVYWPAFLHSAGLSIPKSLFVHGYFTVNGQKMSKTLGNVIDPIEIIRKYGVDAVRYYFLREIPAYNDGDFSDRRFQELYSADLANGLGNLVARTTKLAQNISFPTDKVIKRDNALKLDVDAKLKEYKFNEALEIIWISVRNVDKYLSGEKPWINRPAETSDLWKVIILSEALTSIKEIAEVLSPFLPTVSEKILRIYKKPTIETIEPLFPRIA